MSGGTGIIIGFLGSAAFFLVMLAVVGSRPQAPRPARSLAVRPVGVQPVRVQPPVVQAEIVEDEEAALHMQAVREANKRITSISRWVHETIIGEVLRRSGALGSDGRTSDRPER